MTNQGFNKSDFINAEHDFAYKGACRFWGLSPDDPAAKERYNAIQGECALKLLNGEFNG